MASGGCEPPGTSKHRGGSHPPLAQQGRMAMPRHQELPEQFGRYRILDKLGAGGMGAVYLAEDTKLGRKVALKVPHFKLGDGTAILERFRREARLAAGIDHPNFCQVHDVDEV